MQVQPHTCPPNVQKLCQNISLPVYVYVYTYTYNTDTHTHIPMCVPHAYTFGIYIISAICSTVYIHKHIVHAYTNTDKQTGHCCFGQTMDYEAVCRPCHCGSLEASSTTHRACIRPCHGPSSPVIPQHHSQLRTWSGKANKKGRLQKPLEGVMVLLQLRHARKYNFCRCRCSPWMK